MGKYSQLGGQIGQQLGNAYLSEAEAGRTRDREGEAQEAYGDIFGLFEDAGLDPNEVQKAMESPDKVLELLSDPAYRDEVNEILKEQGHAGIEGDLPGDVTRGVKAPGGMESPDARGQAPAPTQNMEGSDVGNLVGSSVDTESRESRRSKMDSVYFKGLKRVMEMDPEHRKDAMSLLEGLDKRFRGRTSDEEMTTQEKIDARQKSEFETMDRRDQLADRNREEKHKQDLELLQKRYDYDTRKQQSSSKNSSMSKLATKRWMKLEAQTDERANEVGHEAYDAPLDFVTKQRDRIQAEIDKDMAELNDGNVYNKQAQQSIMDNIKEMQDDVRELDESIAMMQYKKVQMQGGGKSTVDNKATIAKLKKLLATKKGEERERLKAKILELERGK